MRAPRTGDVTATLIGRQLTQAEHIVLRHAALGKRLTYLAARLTSTGYRRAVHRHVLAWQETLDQADIVRSV